MFIVNNYISVLKKYVQFDGRATRSEYWYFFLMNVIVSVVVSFVTALIRLPALGSLYTLAVLLPGIAVAIRRMHDVGKSGWYVLIPIYDLILAITDSEKVANAYGEYVPFVAEDTAPATNTTSPSPETPSTPTAPSNENTATAAPTPEPAPVAETPTETTPPQS